MTTRAALIEYPTKSCLVYDQGLFLSLAETLAPHFGKVGYFCPWEDQFVRGTKVRIGHGIPGIERVLDFWGSLDDWDLFVFPDVNHGGLQVDLADNRGKRVWGSRYGEDYELYRRETKELFSEYGFSIGDYAVIYGLSNLREYLKKHDNVYVKCSLTRGDFESFHAPNYEAVKHTLDRFAVMWGEAQEYVEFIVEHAIIDAVEIGYDGYSVDGKFPSLACIGLEVKDKGYVGHMRPVAEQPEPILDVNRRMAPILAKDRYRNFFAVETRITKDGKPWVIDPCCRMGSPPGELLQNLYTNLHEIFWEGSGGNLVDPVPENEWGAELIIHASEADAQWMHIQVPDKYVRNVKLRNASQFGDKKCTMPQGHKLPEIGAVVATGSTMEEAFEKCGEIAKEIVGYRMEYFDDCFEEAQDELKKFEEFGYAL